MDSTKIMGLLMSFWKTQLMPALNAALLWAKGAWAMLIVLVEKQPLMSAIIAAAIAGLITLLIGVSFIMRTRRRNKGYGHSQRRTASYVPELDGLRSASGAGTHEIASRFATPHAAPTHEAASPELNIPHLSENTPAMPMATPNPNLSPPPTPAPTLQTIPPSAPPAPPVPPPPANPQETGTNDIHRLAEAERKLHALRELYQAGLIAPEIYILKAREYAAIAP